MKPAPDKQQQKQKTRGIKRKRKTRKRSKKINSTSSLNETDNKVDSIALRIKSQKRTQYQKQVEGFPTKWVFTSSEEEIEVKNTIAKESNEVNENFSPKSEDSKIPSADIKVESNCTTEEHAKTQIDFSQFVKEKTHFEFDQRMKSKIPTKIHEDEINTNRIQNDENDEYTTRICLYFTTARITTEMQTVYSGTDHSSPNTITTPICTSSSSTFNLTPNTYKNSPVFDTGNNYLEDPFYTYNISNLSSQIAFNFSKIIESSSQLSNTPQVTSNQENEYQITISNVCSISESEFSEMNSDKDSLLTILSEFQTSEDGNNDVTEDTENFESLNVNQSDLCPCENLNDLIEYANLNLDAIVDQNIEY